MRTLLFLVLLATLLGWLWRSGYLPIAKELVTPDEATTVRVEAAADQLVQGAKQLAHVTFNRDQWQSICHRQSDRDIDQVDSTAIYRWTDANGRVHFGDQRQQGVAAQDLTANYRADKQYFRFQLNNYASRLPSGFEDDLEAATRKVFQLLGEQGGIQQRKQVDLNVTVHSDFKRYTAYREQLAPDLANNPPGFYSYKHHEAVVFLGQDHPQAAKTALHEAIHVIMAGLFGPTPRWFSEGVAEYFEPMQIRGQAATIEASRYWWQSLQRTGALPLRTMMAADQEMWSGAEIERLYASAWSLIYFLMESPERRAWMAQLMGELQQHVCLAFSFERYIESHYPGGVTGLESEWRAWLGGRKLPSPHRY